MAGSRSLGTLTVDLVAKIAGFEQGMNKAERELDKRAKRMNDVAKKIGVGIGTAITVGVAASAALATGLKISIDRMDELSKAALRASLPTEQFTQLAYAGDLADVSMEELTKSLGKLAKAQGDAQAGLKTQKDAFNQLGIAYSNANGSLRSTHEVFLDFADAFQKYKGSPEVVAAGMQIFGRSFQTLIPLLKDGRAGLEAAADEADRLGITLSTQAGQNAEAFNDNLTRLNTAMKGLWQTLASDLLPYLVELTDKFVDGIKEGGDLRAVAQNLATAIEGVGRAAESAIGPLARYYDWLQKTGRVEGNTADELEARRDALVENRRSFFAELTGSTGEIDREIARIDAKIAKLNSPFANVRGGSSSSYDIANRPDPILPPGAGGSRSKQLSDEEKEAKRLLETYQRLTATYDERIALFGKEGEAAKVRYDIEFGELSKLSPAQKADLLDRAERLDLMDEELELQQKLAAEDQRRLDSYTDVMQAIKDQTQLVGLSWEQQEIWNNLKWAGVDADSDWGRQIIASTKALQEQREAMEDQIEIMDGARDGAREFFDSMREGEGILKSLEDAFGRFADALYDWATNSLIDQFFGKQGASGQGTAGGGWLSALFGSSGSSQGSIFDLFSGSWGFAGGGTMPAYSAARVNELGMEMASVGGNDYLLTGSRPVEITPHRALGRGGASVTQNFYNPVMSNAKTQFQIAQEQAVKAQRAMARS